MNRNASLNWLWASLMIIGILSFGVISSVLFAFGNLFPHGTKLWGLIPIPIVALLVWGMISLFSKKEITDRKTYKSEEIREPMKIQYLFYFVGVIFVFISVWYFAYKWIALFPRIIKLILLLVSVVVSYIVAEFMRRSDI